MLPHALAGLGRGDVVEPGRALAVAQRAEPMPLRDLCSVRYSALIAGRCVICGGLDPANGPTPPPRLQGGVGVGDENQQPQQLQHHKQLLLYCIYYICDYRSNHSCHQHPPRGGGLCIWAASCSAGALADHFAAPEFGARQVQCRCLPLAN